MRRRWWILATPKRIRPMGLVAVQMSINPFELFMAVAVCAIGILYLLGFPPPTTVKVLLPELAVKVWAANLGIGGLAILGGGLWYRHLDRGLAAYQFGWGLAGVGTLIYGIGLVILHPVSGINPALSNVFFAGACFVRVIQVQRFFALSQQFHQSGEDGSS